MLLFLLPNRYLRHLEGNLRVGAVAERLRRRYTATTQRYRLVLRAELVALGINDDRILNQVRSVEGSNLLVQP